MKFTFIHLCSVTILNLNHPHPSLFQLCETYDLSSDTVVGVAAGVHTKVISPQALNVPTLAFGALPTNAHRQTQIRFRHRLCRRGLVLITQKRMIATCHCYFLISRQLISSFYQMNPNTCREALWRLGFLDYWSTDTISRLWLICTNPLRERGGMTNNYHVERTVPGLKPPRR